ncbi:MAG: CYTH domain-containing protein [Firmicutes bacterium]|nr:CYTH domain-containing protein [Bacillota bacterium]
MSFIETEIKYLLSKESFKRLYNHLKQYNKNPSLIRQVNYYFDPVDLSMQQHRINIRIRLLKGMSELTCKIPKDDIIKDNIQNSYEYNVELSRSEALYYIENGLSSQALLKHFGNIFDHHDLITYDTICYGHLRTARIHFDIIDSLAPLLLDINAYLGTFDYELEWELAEVQVANKILHDLFDTLAISPIGQMKPKRKRFFQQLL